VPSGHRNKNYSKLRVGLIAVRNIRKDEELVFEYWIRGKELPWTIADAKKLPGL